MDAEWLAVDGEVRRLANAWRAERAQRQARRHLERVDFDGLRSSGFLRLVAPRAHGGLWDSAEQSTRPLAEMLRALAGADPAVALVLTMHPSVIAFWLLNPGPDDAEWQRQREAVFDSAVAGQQWGTITSEPGSGGDILRSKAIAALIADAGDGDATVPLPGRQYRVSGEKHFGSGSGIVDWMITSAVPSDDPSPTLMALPVAGRPWDGSAGLLLTAEWDGAGMAATQSHAMRLVEMPAVRLARPGPVTEVAAGSGAMIAVLFTAVVLGVVDEAMAFAKQTVRSKADQLRPLEQVEWSQAVIDHWCAQQAYEGALRAIETGDPTVRFRSLCAKQAAAQLAEQITTRLGRVLGGGSYSRRNPISHWNEDVRALGFLRPPWGLAFDNLFALSLD